MTVIRRVGARAASSLDSGAASVLAITTSLIADCCVLASLCALFVSYATNVSR
jgi:hypothetical protein